MESRPAYNYLGEEVATLTYPDGTPESVWEEALAKIASPPQAPPSAFDVETEAAAFEIRLGIRLIAKMCARNRLRMKAGTLNPAHIPAMIEQLKPVAVMMIFGGSLKLGKIAASSLTPSEDLPIEVIEEFMGYFDEAIAQADGRKT